jgi:hypothetical protein
VNVAPLFTARAAFADPTANALWTISFNQSRIEKAVAGTGWAPVANHAGLTCGIRLYRTSSFEVRGRDAEFTRARFHRCGVALTAYEGGLIRLSTPKGVIPDREYDQLRQAFLRSEDPHYETSVSPAVNGQAADRRSRDE